MRYFSYNMMYYRISKNEKNLFFGKKIAQVWAVTLSGPIGQIYAHNKMSDVFNLGLITPVAYYSLPMLFSIILRFH